VDEDGNTSLYTIKPSAPTGSQVKHYTYSPAPDSGATGGVLTGGGSDAVSVRDGQIYISASAPSASNATAVFAVRLDRHAGVAYLSPTFADNATATDATTGNSVTLALTDPDSNANVPASSPRFAGQFALVSQADQQIIFARGLGWGGDGWGGNGSGSPQLTRLGLTYGGMSAGVDDVRWAAQDGGTMLVVDNKANTIYSITGPFQAGQAFAGLDTVGSTTNTTELDTIDLSTGALSPFATGFSTVKGLLWLPGGAQGDGSGDRHGDGGDSGSGGQEHGRDRGHGFGATEH
jgi:hypothetical protein